MSGTVGRRGESKPVGAEAGQGHSGPLTDLAFNILVALEGRPLHGYALIKQLRRLSGRARLRTGTVYAALSRLTADRWVREVDPPGDHADGDERRRYYALTESGRAAAAAEARRLAEVLALARAKRLAPDSPPS
ncbi:MAG: PadR family transcriptional regulator [Gemmatimonadetes bacterium]|nr:PadR family transcriptional regulator [Gemmatimonadota bacterium]